MSEIKKTISKSEYSPCSICGSTASKRCDCKYNCPHLHHPRKKNGKPYQRSACEACNATCSHHDKVWDNVSLRFVPPDRKIVIASESPQQQQPQFFDVTWDDLDALEAEQAAQAAQAGEAAQAAQAGEAAQAAQVVEVSDSEIAAMEALFDNPASTRLW
jgi:hypothetical protein